MAAPSSLPLQQRDMNYAELIRVDLTCRAEVFSSPRPDNQALMVQLPLARWRDRTWQRLTGRNDGGLPGG
jgi:hypothetical protein